MARRHGIPSRVRHRYLRWRIPKPTPADINRMHTLEEIVNCTPSMEPGGPERMAEARRRAEGDEGTVPGGCLMNPTLYAILGGGVVLAYLLIVFIAGRSHTRMQEEATRQHKLDLAEAARRQAETLERYR
jgi:hypothetical protein